MDLIINNDNNYNIDEDIKAAAKELAKLILSEEGLSTDYEISLSFVSDVEINELNRDYRNINKVTDVLSFPLIEDFTKKETMLGDIVISYDTAKRQSEEYGHSLKREILFLICHSMLHLLGYDHMNKEEEEDMFSKQEHYLEMLNINR